MNKLAIRKGKKPLSETCGTEKGDNMKKLAVFVVGAVLAVSAFGQDATWLGDSFLHVYAGEFGPPTTFYGCSAPVQDFITNSFQGANLGVFRTNIMFDAVVSTRGESAPQETFALVHYRVGLPGTTSIWQQTQMTWYDEDQGTNVFTAGELYGGPTGDITVDISHLASGVEYELSVFFSKPSTQGGTLYDDNSGNYFIAKFEKYPPSVPIPEPATVSLLGVGALAMVLHRKRRR